MLRMLTLALTMSLAFTACQKSAEKPAEKTTEKPDAQKEAPKADAHADHGAHADHAATGEKKDPAPTTTKRVFFVSPADGAKVKSPVKVAFGVEGMGIRPAGEDVKDQTTGHHHIIVDGAFVPKGTVVPKDDKHIHFGGGQTETELKLAPGEHTLTMQLADGAHISYGEPLSATIKVTVEK
jgi:hypothetical protein